MELHEAKEGGKSYYRIYTHYGRTDDIGAGGGGGEQNDADAQFEFRQCRYLNSLQQANVVVSAMNIPFMVITSFLF